MKRRLKLIDSVTILPGVRLPAGHAPGMRVPVGGSSCSNCRFGDIRTNTCSEPNFIRLNGSSKVPLPLSLYCSDWWQPRNSVREYSWRTKMLRRIAYRKRRRTISARRR